MFIIKFPKEGVVLAHFWLKQPLLLLTLDIFLLHIARKPHGLLSLRMNGSLFLFLQNNSYRVQFDPKNKMGACAEGTVSGMWH